MFIIYIYIKGGVIIYYIFLLSTNKMVVENFKVEVDVQITILIFYK